MKLYVHGLGLWHRGVGDLSAWLANKTDASLIRSGGAVLSPALRRRATDACKMGADAFAQAQAAAHGDPGKVALLFVSHLGEIQTTMELLAEVAAPGQSVSPMRFHNSVHNAAAGYLSIALGLRRSATAIGAGYCGLAMGLLEATMQVSDAQDVALVVSEESGASPFDQGAVYGNGATAWWLSKRNRDDQSALWLSLDAQPCDDNAHVLSNVDPTIAAVPGLVALYWSQQLAKRVTARELGRELVGWDPLTQTTWWATLGGDDQGLRAALQARGVP